MPGERYPLRSPAVWTRPPEFGIGTLVFGVVLLLIGVGVGILVLVEDVTPQAPLYAVAGGGGVAAWGFILIGIALPTHRKPPELVNAVAVTPGDEKLPDDWVHLFRRRRAARALVFGLAALGLYMLVIAAGSVWSVLSGNEDVWILAFVAFPVFSAVVMGGIALREWLSRRRLGTFGRPPTGLTVGRSGFTLLEPHRTRFVPWESVTGVTARNAPTRGGESHHHPMLDIAIGDERVPVPLTQYVAAPRVIYSTLVSGLEDAAFRGELGTTHVQGVLEEWATEATPAR